MTIRVYCQNHFLSKQRPYIIRTGICQKLFQNVKSSNNRMLFTATLPWISSANILKNRAPSDRRLKIFVNIVTNSEVRIIV